MSRICPFGVAGAVVLGACALVVVAGCGNGNWTATAPGDVPLTISVVADTPGSISSVTLATGRADTLDVTDASARIERADGTSRNVALSNNVTSNIVTFGQARVTPSGADIATSEAATNGPAQADVPFLAEIAVNPPDEIASATVTALEAGDTFDITGATATLERSDGTTESVALSINAEGTVVSMGRVALAGCGTFYPNMLAIQGPIRVQDGPTGTATEIGALLFGFQVTPLDRTVVLPRAIRASIPTIGCARDGRVVVEGLIPRKTYVWTSVTDKDGGHIYSRPYTTDASGQAVIPDTKSQITAELLSGPNSRIVLFSKHWEWGWFPPGGPRAPVGPDPDHRGQLNVLVVDGPVRIRNGITTRITEIGQLRLGFEVLADGTVIAPGQIKLNIPTNGTVGDPRAIVTGLDAGDFVRTSVVDANGARSSSPIRMADASGRAAIAQAMGGIGAARLSGPKSQISLSFARTDADRDGYPDVF